MLAQEVAHSHFPVVWLIVILGIGLPLLGLLFGKRRGKASSRFSSPGTELRLGLSVGKRRSEASSGLSLSGIETQEGAQQPPAGSRPLPALAQAMPSAAGYADRCPVCGCELPVDAPQGMCAQCLMQCVISRSDLGQADADGARTTPYPSLPPVPTPAELAPLFPDLEILELLGQGGMGAVYKARQRKLDRFVALKVLPADWGRDPAFAERFSREARTLARLNHPEIVSVHDFGEAGRHYFLLMEFVDGANLRQLLMTGRLQPRQALPIVAQICEALQYAHEQGVIHRDIKPENILIDKRGRVKIADFGLAKLLGRNRNEYTLTGSRQVMGTLDYMAPEQRTKPQEVDHRADIYSLGVVFYEMLTGELPLGRFAAPSEKAGVDSRLDEIVFRALEREPNRRYPRISAVKADVQAILGGQHSAPAVPFGVGGEPDQAALQLRMRGPAAGMVVVAFLVLAESLAFSAVTHRIEDSTWIGVIGLVLAGILLTGAYKLARCRGYEWVMAAAMLMLLPLGPHFLVSLAIGIWTLVVLSKPDVKAAFASNLRPASGAGASLGGSGNWSPRRLMRSSSERWLAGVCGGMARALGMDPGVVRVLYAVLSFFTGTVPGVVVYFVLALLLPTDDVLPTALPLPPQPEPVPEPTVGARPGKVRGFLLSVFSVFASRPDISLAAPGRVAAAADQGDAEPTPRPAGPRAGEPRKKGHWALWPGIALGLALVLCLCIGFFWFLYRFAPGPPATVIIGRSPPVQRREADLGTSGNMQPAHSGAGKSGR
jgi:phage shock protein PspC (stress-responsive transcriptional regulator)/tRNA A-37 threonylcarbamoyl transferase component Bud32